MAPKPLPLLPTTVIGSYATPSWLWTAIGEIDKGNYGPTDIKETYDDAVNIAIMDQQRAGVDIITDGEMRRYYFVQSFNKRMTGIVPDPPLRKVGLYGYDTPPRYHTVEKVTVPDGLGIVEEFNYTKTHTTRPIKATCPGAVDDQLTHTTQGGLQGQAGASLGVHPRYQRRAKSAGGGGRRLHSAR